MKSSKSKDKQRPIPSIEIRVPTLFSRLLQVKDVNWLLWSVLMISDRSNEAAQFIASAQKSAASVLVAAKPTPSG